MTVVDAGPAKSMAVGSAEPIFDLRDVGYSYSGRQVALDGVNLRLWSGERVAILGANGSGKSTLLKILDGVIGPTVGTVRALGRDVAAVAAGEGGFEFHREVGLVFQDPDIQLFCATVLDDVAFGPLQLGLTHDEVRERSDEAMAEMGIAHLADRAPFELSGGEKKRAAIAAVLSLRPEVVLLDEPTASLDPRTKWVLVDLIQRLAAAGRTLSEEGGIVADGPAATILADRDLLIRVNLIHEHLHGHGAVAHSHPHAPAGGHHGPSSAATGTRPATEDRA